MSQQEKLRIFYAAGPGDVIGTFHFWKNKQADPALLWIADSAQFYDLITELDATARVISTCTRKDHLQEGRFNISQIPKKSSSGLFYHLHHTFYGLKLCVEIIRFKTNIAVIEESTSYWFVWNILSLFGITVIPSLKALLWAPFEPITFKQRLINKLDRILFQKKGLTVLSISDAVSNQVRQLAENKLPNILRFVTIYEKGVFNDVMPPNLLQRPFRVLFMGRLDPCKGIFDLLEIAKQFKKDGITDIHFDFCGGGPFEDQLKKQIEHDNLLDICHLHGICKRDKLKKIMGTSHVIIAPTKTAEGLPNAVIEGVLAGRPVIASAICPAIQMVPNSVIEPLPNDIKSYSNAILSLYNDPILYQQKLDACHSEAQQFYDMRNSWKSALRQAIENFVTK